MSNKLIKLLVLVFTFSFLNGQDTIAPKDTTWKTGGFTSVNFSQVSLSNWVVGG